MSLARQLCAAGIERDSFPFMRLSGVRAALVAPARFGVGGELRTLAYLRRG
jgi:hypothetical protein